MKPSALLFLAALVALPSFAAEKPKQPAAAKGGEVKLKPLTLEQRQALLARRRSPMVMGAFNSFASLLYAVDDIVVHTDEPELAKVRLNSPFPEFYKPTWAEMFDAIARQMGCSWSYDEKRAYWVFAKPAMPMPFKVDLAKGWESEARGNYLFCKPPGSPVGMDIYVMAGYSSSPDDPELPAKMREGVAMIFAQNFKKDVTVKDMSIVKVGTHDALHFKVPTPRPGTTWRQWAIAEGGQTVVVVSAIDDAKESEVLPGVEAAIKTFEMKKPVVTPQSEPPKK